MRPEATEVEGTEHWWVDAGFIHENIVCKYCDSEKRNTFTADCPARLREKSKWEYFGTYW